MHDEGGVIQSLKDEIGSNLNQMERRGYLPTIRTIIIYTTNKLTGV